jgi:hypothetical protein
MMEWGYYDNGKVASNSACRRSQILTILWCGKKCNISAVERGTPVIYTYYPIVFFAILQTPLTLMPIEECVELYIHSPTTSS